MIRRSTLPTGATTSRSKSHSTGLHQTQGGSLRPAASVLVDPDRHRGTAFTLKWSNHIATGMNTVYLRSRSRSGQLRCWRDHGSIGRGALSVGLVELIPEERPGGARRRARASAPRRRQVVVRFSSAELGLVRERAALAGLAVGAWIGQAAIDAAEGSTSRSIGLPDLLRLHADVALARQVLGSGGVEVTDRMACLLARLDAAIDVVVTEFERGSR